MNLENHLINIGVEYIFNKFVEGKFVYKSNLEYYLILQLEELDINYRNYQINFGCLIYKIENYTSTLENIFEYKKLEV